MPRAHLSKRLDDATAIQLFAEHHIVHVRRRKNGEIVAVKHSTFGWMSPQSYYGLQKIHDLLPFVEEFIRGGYMAKAWLWSVGVDVLGITVPVGASLPAIEAWNLYEELTRTKTLDDGTKVPALDFGMIALRAYALMGPWGDVIQIIDSIATSGNALSSKDFWNYYLGGLIGGLLGPTVPAVKSGTAGPALPAPLPPL